MSGFRRELKARLHLVIQLIDRVAGHFSLDPRIFAKYVVVGGTSAVIEISLFAFFYSTIGWPLLVANSCALVLTLFFHFNMQKRWTFQDSQCVRRQLPRYLVMIGITSLLNNLLMYLFVVLFGLPALLSKVLQIGLVFGFSFSFSRFVVFANR